MNRNFTLLYMFNTLEDYSSELMDDVSTGPPVENTFQDVFSYLDDHLAEVGRTVVDRVIRYAGDYSSQP